MRLREDGPSPSGRGWREAPGEGSGEDMCVYSTLTRPSWSLSQRGEGPRPPIPARKSLEDMAKLVIAGEQRDASDGGTREIRNPATGEIVDRVAAGTQADIDNAIDPPNRLQEMVCYPAAAARGDSV